MEERKNNEQTRKKKLWFPLAVTAPAQSSLFSFSLVINYFSSYVPPPFPEASTNHLPPSHCTVHAGPCGDPSDAQLEGEPCEAQYVGVRGDVWKAMTIGIHWVGGAERPAESGSAQAQSSQW